MIISASRRTDIPAFYGRWFMNRIRAGYCLVANPFNPKSVTQVSLAPSAVDVIVFWSKDPGPMFSHLDELDARGYRYYFLYTLNHYPLCLEPGVPPYDERIETFIALAARLGPARVVWRYDPVILTRDLDCRWHEDVFEITASALRGATQRVIISLVDFYRKTERRLARVEKETGDLVCRKPLSHPAVAELVRAMSAIAGRNGMEIQGCAETDAFAALGVPAGKCVDDQLINTALGVDVSGVKDSGQRGACRCMVARDIGATDSCLHGCEYCYATVSAKAAGVRAERHDPDGLILIP